MGQTELRNDGVLRSSHKPSPLPYGCSHSLASVQIIPPVRIMAPPQAKPIGPMQLVRARLTEKPHSLRSSLPTRRNAAENNRYVEKETPRPSRFIADSSPAGNKADVREHEAKQHGGIAPLRKISSKGYCEGIGVTI